MEYISTRGNAPELNFEDVIITGLATDGGLYVPETWPQLSPDQIRSFASMPYCDVAYEVMAPFVDGAINDNVLKDIIAEAYTGFSHPAIAPLKEMRPNEWILENPWSDVCLQRYSSSGIEPFDRPCSRKKR